MLDPENHQGGKMLNKIIEVLQRMPFIYKVYLAILISLIMAIIFDIS